MFIKPCHGLVTSLYSNSRLNPVLGVVRPHWGIDYGGAPDNTITAAAAGSVRLVVNGTTGYGKYIIITHSNGWETLYAHLSSISVKDGQKVSQGQKIGVKGTTGNSTGIHLHFEISKGRWSNQYRHHVNPAHYIDDPEVRKLQTMLNQLGYKLTVDGLYGDATTKAVVAYQKANRLTADGAAGRLTMAALEKSIASIVPDKPVADVPKKEEIRIFKPTRKIFKDQTQDLFRLAREAGIFSSDDHEKKVAKGEMPLDDAIGAIATIVKRVHFDKI